MRQCSRSAALPAWGVLLLLLLGACGGDAPPEEAATLPAPAPTPKAPPPEPGPVYVTGHVKAVDLDGNALANMAPVVTSRPNAFDRPLATGPLTGEDGLTTFQFPGNQKVYVRAWDPELARFPNNYYDILPGGGETDTLVVVMVQGASIEALLLLPAGEAAANDNVGLMMFHPTEGPWWPTEADTGLDGAVRFPKVPAGTYVLRLKTASGHAVEIPEVHLPPGAEVDLGTVTLR